MNVRVTAASIAVAASTLATASSLAGSLDPGFGTAGKVVTAFADRSSNIAAVAVQPDGKIVAAGTAWSSTEDGDFALARYNPDGSLDQTFGTGGLVTTDFGGSDGTLSVAIQPDAKIVAGGIGGGDFALARYKPDGRLDVSFGEGGKVVADFGNADYVVRVFPVRGGGVIAVGASGDRTVRAENDLVVLARYRSDGTLDRRFGRQGRVVMRARHLNLGAARAPSGKIVVAAPRLADPKITTNPPIDFVLLRYRTDGALDRTFGRRGVVTWRAGPSSTGGAAVAVQRDGRIVVGGHGHRSTPGPAGPNALMLVRFRADGALDRTFGDRGVSVSEVGFGIRAITIDRQGRIVAAGASGVEPPADLQDFVVGRYTARGLFDTSFGAVTTDFGAYDTPFAVAVQPDGAIVAAGQMGVGLLVDTDFALARYR